MKKTWLHVDRQLEKERSILIDFSNSYGNTLLMLEQNLATGCFLRTGCKSAMKPCQGTKRVHEGKSR